MLAVGVEVEEELTTPSVGAVMEVEVEVDSLGGVGAGISLGMGASVASGRARGSTGASGWGIGGKVGVGVGWLPPQPTSARSSKTRMPGYLRGESRGARSLSMIAE